MIYLDAAAVVKLVRKEQHSDQLKSWLTDRSHAPLVSSALVEVEVPRAIRRNAPAALSGVPSVLIRLYRLEVDGTVRTTAAAFTDPLIRSLDAIHLATAQLLEGQLEAFVTYDKRLLAAAAGLGLPTAAPGDAGPPH